MTALNLEKISSIFLSSEESSPTMSENGKAFITIKSSYDHIGYYTQTIRFYELKGSEFIPSK